MAPGNISGPLNAHVRTLLAWRSPAPGIVCSLVRVAVVTRTQYQVAYTPYMEMYRVDSVIRSGDADDKTATADEGGGKVVYPLSVSLSACLLHVSHK